MRLLAGFSILFFLLFPGPVELFAQGPPIITDTPIMLGLQGRGVRTFVKVMKKATILQNGDRQANTDDRRVTVWLAPLVVPYNLFSDRFQVGVVLPFLDIDSKTGNNTVANTGIGDLRLFAKFLLYQRDRRNETLRVAAKAGVKLATGAKDEVPALGSGSTDYFFSSVAGWIKRRVGIYAEGIFNLNTSNSGVHFGNSFAYNLALGYRLIPVIYETYPSPQLNGFLEINGTTAAKGKVNGVTNKNSGGTTVFLSPGLQYVGGRRWLIELSFQYPIMNQPNGRQLATDWTFSLGTRILLF